MTEPQMDEQLQELGARLGIQEINAKALDAVMDRCADALNKEDARHNRKSKRIKRKFSRQYKALIEKMIGGAQ